MEEKEEEEEDDGGGGGEGGGGDGEGEGGGGGEADVTLGVEQCVVPCCEPVSIPLQCLQREARISLRLTAAYPAVFVLNDCCFRDNNVFFSE